MNCSKRLWQGIDLCGEKSPLPHKPDWISGCTCWVEGVHLVGWGVLLWLFSHVYSLPVVFWSYLDLWVYYLAQKMRGTPLVFYKDICTKCVPSYPIWGCTWGVEGVHYGFLAMLICFNSFLIIFRPLSILFCSKNERMHLVFYKKSSLNVHPFTGIGGVLGGLRGFIVTFQPSLYSFCGVLIIVWFMSILSCPANKGNASCIS